jgi:teichuronic acid biosynthesis glycosyltransferase TuaC
LPKLMIQAAAKAASGIVAVSHAIKSAIVELGIPPDAITVLRNGVDLETFHARGRQAARSELKLSRRTLLSVGQLIERKGHALVIDALKSLPECDLLIAGEGPEQNALQKFAAEIGVADRVRFLGNVDHHALQKVYVASDALVLASSREGWPNVLLEAMACGTPVVATPIWGNPEVVSAPEAGVLTRSRDTPSIVDAVKKLFRNLPDRMRTRAYAEKFSWKETTDGQILLFNKILNAAQ